MFSHRCGDKENVQRMLNIGDSNEQLSQHWNTRNFSLRDILDLSHGTPRGREVACHPGKTLPAGFPNFPIRIFTLLPVCLVLKHVTSGGPVTATLALLSCHLLSGSHQKPNTQTPNNTKNFQLREGHFRKFPQETRYLSTLPRTFQGRPVNSYVLGDLQPRSP